MDLEGFYLGAFSDRGEVIEMGSGELFATFTPTGRLDPEALTSLIKQAGDRRNLRPAHTSTRWRFWSKAASATERPIEA